MNTKMQQVYTCVLCGAFYNYIDTLKYHISLHMCSINEECHGMTEDYDEQSVKQEPHENVNTVDTIQSYSLNLHSRKQSGETI